MLKKLLSALTGLMLFISMPLAALAAERYEILQVGDEDAWVMELQIKLNELGYLEVPATGYYGTNTQNAVLRYQQDHGLTADGKAGPVTRQSILGDSYREITGPRIPGVDMSAAGSSGSIVSGELSRPGTSSSAASAPVPEPSPTQPPAASEQPPDTPPDSGTEPAPSEDAQTPPSASTDQEPPEGDPQPPADGDEPSAPTEGSSVMALQPGDKGEAVSQLQEKLRDFDYYDYGSITGYYGPVTQEAVERFERSNGLEVDGVMSAEDLALLNSGDCRYYTMRVGDTGEGVKRLQERLKELGYISGSVTGYYGNVTEAAIAEFQRNSGLEADGAAGRETREALFSDDAAPSGAVVSPPPENDGSEVPSDNPSQEDPGNPGNAATEPGDEPGSEEPGADPDDGNKEPEPGKDPDEDDPDDDPDDSVSSGVRKLIEVAETRIGKPYVYGASGPNSFDCSGFVYYCLKGAGVSVSRMSSASYATVSSWEPVKNKSSLRVGDLVFFKSDSSSAISHVGIYLGGGNFIHSAPSTGGVGYSTMSSGYYSRNFVSARRVFK